MQSCSAKLSRNHKKNPVSGPYSIESESKSSQKSQSVSGWPWIRIRNTVKTMDPNPGPYLLEIICDKKILAEEVKGKIGKNVIRLFCYCFEGFFVAWFRLWNQQNYPHKIAWMRIHYLHFFNSSAANANRWEEKEDMYMFRNRREKWQEQIQCINFCF